MQAGSREHKLLIYADDALVLVRNPDPSNPHFMENIQSYSKASGYKINWTKSEATPMSGEGNANVATKVGY